MQEVHLSLFTGDTGISILGAGADSVVGLRLSPNFAIFCDSVDRVLHCITNVR